MNKIVIGMAFFIGMLSPLVAQKKFVITLPMGKAKLSDNNFHVTKVFDHRINQDNIGVIQKGMNNKKQLAVFSEPTPIHLQNALNWMLSSSSKDRTPLVVSIRKLFISEKTTAWKEYGTAEVSLEFLTPDSLSYGVFHSTIDGKGMDVTQKHGQRVNQALQDCLRQFSSSKKVATKLVTITAPTSANTQFEANEFF